MSPGEQVEVVFEMLKKHLKGRKLTYREVASRVRMSEANMKRILSSRSCSFDRLAQICEAAEISLPDLVVAASKSDSHRYSLTEDAESYFLKHFDCFIFYRRISSARDVNEGISKARIPAEKLRGYLSALERLGLLTRARAGYRLKNWGYLQLRPESKLRKKLYDEWVPWFFKRVLEAPAEGDHKLLMFSTGLSDTHYEELLSDLNRLREKYQDLGWMDQRIGSRQTKSVSVCLGIGPYRIGQF